nr:probable pseudouridine-5'-phosphatase [Onthophagus taurus]
MNPSKFIITNLFISKKLPVYLNCRTKSTARYNLYAAVTHCIFDLDGTILDNQQSIDMANKEIFDMYHLQYTPEWRYKLMGKTCKSMWETVINELSLEECTWQKLDLEHSQLYDKYLMGAQLKPGVATLLQHLHKNNIPMAAVTSSSQLMMKKKTSHIKELMAMFSFIVCGDDPKLINSKPSGEIFTICKGCFKDNPPSQSCLVFENTPVGVLAAENASMKVVGISSVLTPFSSLRRADKVLNHFNEFKPEDYGLPSFSEVIH